MDHISKLPTDIMSVIYNSTENENDKHHFALMVPGGDKVFTNTKKTAEFWLQKLEKDHCLQLPTNCINDPLILERFCFLLSITESKANIDVSSYTPEIVMLLSLIARCNNDESFLSIIYDYLCKLFVGSTVSFIESSLPFLLEQLAKEPEFLGKIDHVLGPNLFNYIVKLLHSLSRFDKIHDVLITLHKFFEYKTLDAVVIPFYSYNTAVKILDIFRNFSKEVFPITLKFETHAGTRLKDDFVFQKEYLHTDYYYEITEYLANVDKNYVDCYQLCEDILESNQPLTLNGHIILKNMQDYIHEYELDNKTHHETFQEQYEKYQAGVR